MKKLLVILVAALLMVGAASIADAQYTNKTYSRPYFVVAGADSFYKVPGSIADTRDSTQLLSTFNAAGGSGGADVVYTNWLDISDLVLPEFAESYMDTLRVADAITRTETRTVTTPTHTIAHEPSVRLYGVGTPGIRTEGHVDTWSGTDVQEPSVRLYGAGSPGQETYSHTDTWAGRDTIHVAIRDRGTGIALTDSVIGYAHTVARAATITGSEAVVVDSLTTFSHLVTRVSTITGSKAVVVDSLEVIPETVATHAIAWTEAHVVTQTGQPIGMRLTAWCTSGAASTDSIKITVQVSNDKFGYVPVLDDFIEPSYGTDALILADATPGDASVNIPAGLLAGWKYVRLAVVGDNDHEATLGIKIYHWFRMYQPMGDFGQRGPLAEQG